MKHGTMLLCLPLLCWLPLAEPAEPRIAALSWEPAEHLLQLGITPLTVADAADYRDWVVHPTLPAEVVNVGSRTEPNLERLAQLHPELILITPLLDRKLGEISPIERASMWIGVYEFMHCMDVPWRVVLNECIELAKDFGGTDGHKYVNAVLGGLAPELRSAEVQADRQSGRAK